MNTQSIDQRPLYYDNSTQVSHWFFAILIGSAFTLAAFVILPALNYEDPKNPDPVVELEFMPWQKVQPKPVKPKPVKKRLEKPKPKPVVKPKPKPKPKPIPKPIIAETPAPEPPPPIEEPEPIVEETPPEPVIEETVSEPPAETSQQEVLPAPVPIFQLSNLPRFMRKVNPVYPPNLKRQGINGKVKLSILIDATGKVRDITVLSASHPEFAQAAIDAVKNSSFQAADIGGRPVPTRYKIPFKFRLQ